jgi:hypothetical protein
MFISTDPIDDTMKQKSDALYKYVGSYVGHGGHSSSATSRLLCNKKLLSVVGITAALCIGYALYTKYYASKEEEADEEEEQETRENGQINGGPDEIT